MKTQKISEIINLELIREFIAKLKSDGLGTTGATVKTITADLYNVEGSTDDPKKVPDHENESWKNLLISLVPEITVDSKCYVTNGGEGSHDNFSLGGHMTKESNGGVINKTCYLMPLCYWHNNPARDGDKFEHTKTEMLELTGYMEGELNVTFELRLPSDQPFAVLFCHENEWKFKNITHSEADSLKERVFDHFSPTESIEYYVLIERKKIDTTTTTMHQVVTSNLP